METDILNIFQSLAFPVAINVVLFVFIWWFGRRIMDDNKQRYEQLEKRSNEYIQFLQTAHIEQTAAAKENAAALKENAQALNRFSVVLEKFSEIMDKLMEK
jgi:hypothetical protein